MSLSRFATSNSVELYELKHVRDWLEHEVEGFFLPHLKWVNETRGWANGEDIIVHGSRTGRMIYEYLWPNVKNKYHLVHGMETCASMTEYANKHLNKTVHTEGDRRFDWTTKKTIEFVKPHKESMVQRFLSIHTLQFEADYRALLRYVNDVATFDASFWGILLVKSDLFEIYKYLKSHPTWKDLGKDLVIPDWIENGKEPKEAYTEALTYNLEDRKEPQLAYVKIDINTHDRTFTFANRGECVEFYLALNPKPIEDHVKTEVDRQALYETVYDFLKKLDKKTNDAPYEIKYTSMTWIARKWKPWTTLHADGTIED